jgi:poly(3-hydroxybutyrate) depolymerase
VDENTNATLAETFDKAWDEILVRNIRFNNYKHTHYEGAKYGQYGPYELEPYTVHESLGLKRMAVTLEQKSGLPWLWYEYWPEELIEGAPAASVPVMVLLHGNTNDPRTQAETSGFIQVAGKERFFVVEMEWQGSKNYGVMGFDGVEQVIGILLARYPQLDPSRVYAQGLSAGSITATALGIRKSYVFAAVGGNCGGIYSGAKTGRFSNYDSLWADATQKRGAVEMPYCSMLGTSDLVVPFYTQENYKGNNYLNAWNTYQQLNGMEVTADLDFSIDPIFGLELADRKTITTNKGEGIKVETGFFYKDEKPLIKVIAVVDYGHWNFMPAAQMMWDYFKMFSRDPQTKKLIYHSK